MQATDNVRVETVSSRPLDAASRAKPRVLHLITKFDIGGTERQAVELLKRLDPARYDVRLAVIRGGGPLYREIAARFPRAPEFPLTSFYNRNALRQLMRLRALMKNERIDLLHAHDFYAGIIGSAAARLSGVRVIACQRHLKLSDRCVHEWCTRLIHRLAHRILVNSDAIRDSILERRSAPAGKITVIRNGLRSAFDDTHPIARQELREELCRALGIDSGSKLVGMVANLLEVKGHRFFVEAAARVSQRVAGVHFILVGDGPLRREIEERAARLGIRERVHLLGTRSDAAEIVACFDLAVLASLREGLPNAVMEAMAAGVPVVATAVGGTAELITDGETGYLVPPADADALAERISSALEMEAASAAVAARGREFVLSRYSMDRMVELVEELYDEMLGETGARIKRG